MANQSIEAQIKECVAKFTDDLTSLIRAAAVEAVTDALGGGGKRKPAPTRQSRTITTLKPRPRRKKGRRVRRSMEDLTKLMDEIQAYVRANKGQRLEEMSQGLGISSQEMKRPITMLLEQESLRKEGAKRGTRYFTAGRKRK